ncbi:MAG: type II toxin-antitoxin system HipA family toxin [Acidimicrobiales bacterium]|nr:type II toxin-antitoxin system HipA family toxin [Acidimicrobiales bacterium]
MEVAVHLELGGTWVHAGTLFSHRRRSTESATFAYDAAYLQRPDAYAVDPELPLRSTPSQTRVGAALFGALSDCAPDRWGRTLIKRREAAAARAERRAVRSPSEVDFLLGVRDDLRQGALRFRTGPGEGSGPFLAEERDGVPTLAELPALLALATRAEADTADLDELQRLVHVGSSLGGARPKAHVVDVDGSISIAKFPSSAADTWNVMAWEKVALDLAGAAGIDVPRSRLVQISGRSVLVVHRFDRRADGSRIGYASAMTMLEAADGEQRSYLDIAEVIERHSDRAGQELEQLWRRVVFSVLISNTDDHLRNHGFLHRHHDTWNLSPAFDLNPNPDSGARRLSTTIDEGEDTASLELALEVAGAFRLTDERARAVLAEVVRTVADWPAVAARHGLSRRELVAMQPAFAALDGSS